MLNSVYTHVSSPVEAELINEHRELVLQYQRPQGVPPIFIKIIQSGPFKDWIVSIEDIQLIELEDGNVKPRFGYNICRVPKKITDQDIKQLRNQLDLLICDIFLDIMEQANHFKLTEEQPTNNHNSGEQLSLPLDPPQENS